MQWHFLWHDLFERPLYRAIHCAQSGAGLDYCDFGCGYDKIKHSHSHDYSAGLGKHFADIREGAYRRQPAVLGYGLEHEQHRGHLERRRRWMQRIQLRCDFIERLLYSAIECAQSGTGLRDRDLGGRSDEIGHGDGDDHSAGLGKHLADDGPGSDWATRAVHGNGFEHEQYGGHVERLRQRMQRCGLRHGKRQRILYGTCKHAEPTAGYSDCDIGRRFDEVCKRYGDRHRPRLSQRLARNGAGGCQHQPAVQRDRERHFEHRCHMEPHRWRLRRNGMRNTHFFGTLYGTRHNSYSICRLGDSDFGG